MKENIAKRIESYIKTVARDSFQAEKRTGMFCGQYAELNGYVMLEFRTGFQRVDRRITYRLIQNFQKNTGMQIESSNHTFKIHADQGLITYDQRKLHMGTILDPNHTIAYCQLLGKDTTINCYHKTEGTAEYLNPDFENAAQFSVLWKKFQEADIDTSRFIVQRGEQAWQAYCKAYKTVYGFTPKAQEKLYVSDEIIESYDFA